MKSTLTLIFLYYSIFANADTWTQKANLSGGPRDGCVSFSIGNKGYIGTGFESGTFTWYQDFWEWDPLTDAWTQKADFAGGNRINAIGFSIGNKGYIGTGAAPSLKNDFWEWDQATNTWTQKANFGGAPRWLAVGFSIDSKGYIGIGTINGSNSGAVQDFWEWDQVSDTWIQKANFSGVARVAAVAFTIGTKGYIGTGSDIGLNKHDDFWEWDQATDTWIQKANFGGTARQGAAGFSIGTKGYIGTGDNGVLKKDFWEWDQPTDTWTQKTDFGGAQRWMATGFSIGNKGYIGMGFFFSSSTNDFWEYCDTCSGVGVDELNNLSLISVFPNTAIKKLIISSKTFFKILNLQLYTVSGKKVFESTLNNFTGNSEIDISNYSHGIYLLKLSNGNFSRVYKVLKE
jgi:Secretion system C-terminal sorting domain